MKFKTSLFCRFVHRLDNGGESRSSAGSQNKNFKF